MKHETKQQEIARLRRELDEMRAGPNGHLLQAFERAAVSRAERGAQ